MKPFNTVLLSLEQSENNHQGMHWHWLNAIEKLHIKGLKGHNVRTQLLKLAFVISSLIKVTWYMRLLRQLTPQ